jgi:hypothetical protein
MSTVVAPEAFDIDHQIELSDVDCALTRLESAEESAVALIATRPLAARLPPSVAGDFETGRSKGNAEGYALSRSNSPLSCPLIFETGFGFLFGVAVREMRSSSIIKGENS